METCIINFVKNIREKSSPGTTLHELFTSFLHVAIPTPFGHAQKGALAS